MMSPWDAYRWFDAPVETDVVLPLGDVPVQLCALDVRRVVLILGSTKGVDFQASTRPTPGLGGPQVSKGSVPVILTQQQHGSLCQAEWWGHSSAGATVTVIELRLRDWPHTMEGPPDG